MTSVLRYAFKGKAENGKGCSTFSAHWRRKQDAVRQEQPRRGRWQEGCPELWDVSPGREPELFNLAPVYGVLWMCSYNTGPGSFGQEKVMSKDSHKTICLDRLTLETSVRKIFLKYFTLFWGAIWIKQESDSSSLVRKSVVFIIMKVTFKRQRAWFLHSEVMPN